MKTVTISAGTKEINIRIPDQIPECEAYHYTYNMAQQEARQLGINGVRHRRTLRRIEKALGMQYTKWGLA